MSEPTQAPGGKLRRIALTAKEEQLILEHRRKTEADRAFNDGLDHALEVLSTGISTDGVLTQDEINAVVLSWRADIIRARRDV